MARFVTADNLLPTARVASDFPHLEPAPLVLEDNDAAVFETFVVPSYLRLYWDAAQKVLLIGEAARLAHLGCRTGYPDSDLLERMPHTTGVGVDPSAACLTLARSKAGAMGMEYLQGDPTQTALPAATFSHALSFHPLLDRAGRGRLFAEMARLLYAGGQAIVVFPLSRSFPEILDLLAEYALKHDLLELTRALEKAAAEHLTIETLSDELESAGLSDVDFALSTETFGYDSGRELLEDPATRYLIAPQIAHWLEQGDLAPALEYVGRAIDKYWSEARLELAVTVAAFSARR